VQLIGGHLASLVHSRQKWCFASSAPPMAMNYCYEIYKTEPNTRRSSAAVFLLYEVADSRVLPWIAEFLEDATMTIIRDIGCVTKDVAIDDGECATIKDGPASEICCIVRDNTIHEHDVCATVHVQATTAASRVVLTGRVTVDNRHVGNGNNSCLCWVWSRDMKDSASITPANQQVLRTRTTDNQVFIYQQFSTRQGDDTFCAALSAIRVAQYFCKSNCTTINGVFDGITK